MIARMSSSITGTEVIWCLFILCKALSKGLRLPHNTSLFLAQFSTTIDKQGMFLNTSVSVVGIFSGAGAI